MRIGPMDILAGPPFNSALLLWQPRPGAFMLSVICKVTFTLLPQSSVLADQQDPLNETDDYWDDDERRSLHSASDLVPFKRRADVLLVGHAYAPRAQPVSSLVARLVVGSVDKAIEVHADRVWTQEKELREAAPFIKMPLRWERAAGGSATSNPVGVRADAPPDRYGQVPIPNLQPLGLYVARPEDAIAPVGLGPIAPWWPARREKLYRHARTWDHRTWTERPLPEDIDAAFFNSAPPDQQVDDLRSDERILLENLHADHPRLVTNLPGLRPKALIVRVGGAAQEVRLRCDTLGIDTDRGVCNLVWRGQVMLSSHDEAGRVMITSEGTQGDDGAATIVGGLSPRAALPFRTTPAAPDHPPLTDPTQTTMLPMAHDAAPVLPFREGASPWAAKSPLPERPLAEQSRSDDVGTGTVVSLGGLAGMVLPFETRAQVDPVPAPKVAVPVQVPSFLAVPEPRAVAEVVIAKEAPAPPAMIGPLAKGEVAEKERAPESEEAPPTAPTAPLAPQPEEELPPDAEPVALSIEQVSVVSAELAEGKAPRAEVLRKHDLTERAFTANEHRWAKAMEEEAANGSSRLRFASDRAYVEAVERFRGPITVPEYARILIGLERGRADQVLDDLKIQRPALMRIVRLWTKKVARDAKLNGEARSLLSTMRGS